MTQTPQHLALFYEFDSDLWQQIISFYKNLDPNTNTIFIADEHQSDSVKTHLSELESFQVVSAESLAYTEPIINIPKVITSLEALISSSIPAPKLIFIEMAWSIKTPSASVYLAEYEAALDHFIKRHTLTVVCLYNRSILLDDQLITALHSHETLFIKDQIALNPHFVPPTINAKRNKRAQFDYWLGQLESLNETVPPITGVQRLVGHKQSAHPLQVPDLLHAGSDTQGRWKIACFGHLRVYRVDGEALNWVIPGGATRKTKTLFAYLLYRGKVGASSNELADLLWPDAKVIGKSLNRLYHTIRCLRKVLSPELTDMRKSPFVLNKDDRYYLAVPNDTWLDLPLFQEHCFRGGHHLQEDRLKQALLCYKSAKRLYQGDLLADLPATYAENQDHDWCWSRRYWFRDMYLKLLYGMGTLYRQLGNIEEAHLSCDEALGLEPCLERAHQEKMLIFFSTQRFDAMERQYRLYIDTLEQFNMGSPSKETQLLFEDLKSKM